MKYKRFIIIGHFDVSLDDVLCFLGCDSEDYQPSDDEWLSCARELFECDEFDWMDSEVREA